MSFQDLVLSLRNGAEGGSTGAIIVLAVVLFALIFFVSAMLFLLYSQSPQGKIDALLEARAEDRRTSKWPIRLLVVGLLVLGAFGLNYQISRPSTCGQCHKKDGYVRTAKDAPHKNVRCLACHGGTGALGGIQTATSYGRWILVYTSQRRMPDPKGTTVSDAACLRCHSSVSDGVSVKNGIRVRHKDFLETGSQCRECHNTTGHGEAALEPTTPSMDDCVACHDGKKASSACKTCHVKDELQFATNARKLPKVKQASSANCYGCHDEKPCLRCHGITMPHPKGWAPQDGGPGISGSHALEGFTKREMCWRCHYSNNKPFQRPATLGGFTSTKDGCTCHGSFGNMHGGAAWVKRHGLEASGKAHGPEADCATCHSVDKLCVQCHDASILEKYNPMPGNETYRRDVPKPDGYWEY